MGQIILFAAIALLVVWATLIFNALVRGRNQVSAAWSDIDVQLQRRHDLIPQLVDAVKAYAGYEKSTLETVATLRSVAAATTNVGEIAKVESRIESGVHRLIALAEDYPDLKANANFLDLQTELADVEDHLQYARRFYNGAVKMLNTRIQSFPDLVVARALSFREADFFDAESDAEAAVRVALD